MWLSWILASCVVLSFYDLSKKASVRDNAVFPTLLGSTLSGWLAVTAFLIGRGTFAASVSIPLTQVALLLIKSLIVGASWSCTYMALRTLPVTCAAPIRATGPFWTLLGAIFLFAEWPNALQAVGMAGVLVGCLIFSWSAAHEGINFWHTPAIALAFAGTVLGSCSALYDKHLIQGLGLPTATVLWWFLGGMTIIYALVVLFRRGKKSAHPFAWRWTIPCVGVLLALSDACYFNAVSDPTARISILSMVRRSSVVLTFFIGGAVFHEKNMRRKALALAAILIGVVILCLAKQPQPLKESPSMNTHLSVDELNARYGAPGRIVFRMGHKGAPIAVLANRYGVAEVALMGANTLSYRPTGHAQTLFYSNYDYNRADEVHGGIPVCWPQFGALALPNMSPHGFVRIMPFTVRAAKYSEEMTEITLALTSDDATRALWPHDFDLELTVTVSMKLTLKLVTKNTGTEPFEFTCGLHPYLNVRERDNTFIRGTDGLDYIYAVDMSKGTQRGDLACTNSLNHVYALKPQPKQEFALIDNGLNRALAIVSSGNTNEVIWNPGEGSTFKDVPADAWRHFVCVEPVSSWPKALRKLAPGETHELLVALQSTLNEDK